MRSVIFVLLICLVLGYLTEYRSFKIKPKYTITCEEDNCKSEYQNSISVFFKQSNHGVSVWVRHNGTGYSVAYYPKDSALIHTIIKYASEAENAPDEYLQETMNTLQKFKR